MRVLCDHFVFWTVHYYVELRNLLMTRLTLLNAHRGGKVSILELEDWEDGKVDGWIDQQREYQSYQKVTESYQKVTKHLSNPLR